MHVRFVILSCVAVRVATVRDSSDTKEVFVEWRHNASYKSEQLDQKVDAPNEVHVKMNVSVGNDKKLDEVNATAPSAPGEARKLVLHFITGSPKKYNETTRILNDGGQQLPFDMTYDKISLPEMQGDEKEISRKKCENAAQMVGGPVMIEDTSLGFYALKGMPGPYIKHFMRAFGKEAGEGLHKMLAGFQDKSAYVQTLFAISAGPGCKVEIFAGRKEGMIVPPRGNYGFGFDPIFEPAEPGHLTYAEMTDAEKDKISFRKEALEKVRTWLVQNADAFRSEAKRCT